MKHIAFPIGLVAILFTLLFVAVPAQGASAIYHAPRIAEGTSYSTNWAGYAKGTLPGAVTDVVGSWTVPAITPSNGKNYSSAWVGIDGYNSSTVEQIGTEQDYINGTWSYFAWYEMYPQYPVNFDKKKYPVAPQDKIDAEVKYSGGNFVLTLNDETQGWSTPPITQQASSAPRSSAEWIIEAPWMGTVLPLANFGTISFSGSQATIGGSNVTINNSNSDKIIMTTKGGIVKATPSNISTNPTPGSFTVAWSHK